MKSESYDFLVRPNLFLTDFLFHCMPTNTTAGALDYSHISKHRNLDVSTSLNEVATWAVNQTGFFCSSPKWKILEGGRIEPFDDENARGAAMLTEQLGVPVFPMEQKGVLRTNCIE